MRHRYPVWIVTFSPDGKTLLTGSGDGSAGEGRLWDAASGQLLGSWPHSSRLLTAAFSPDGRTCLTLSVEEAVVRRMPDGKPVGRPLKHPPPPHPLPGLPLPLTGGFSPDSKLIVTAGEDGTVRFWDALTGKAKDKTLRTDSPIQAIAFSPDGHNVLTGCLDGSAAVGRGHRPAPRPHLVTPRPSPCRRLQPRWQNRGHRRRYSGGASPNQEDRNRRRRGSAVARGDGRIARLSFVASLHRLVCRLQPQGTPLVDGLRGWQRPPFPHRHRRANGQGARPFRNRHPGCVQP